MKKTISLILAALMLLPLFASCSETTQKDPAANTDPSGNPNEVVTARICA